MRWLTLDRKKERFWASVDKSGDCWVWTQLTTLFTGGYKHCKVCKWISRGYNANKLMATAGIE